MAGKNRLRWLGGDLQISKGLIGIGRLGMKSPTHGKSSFSMLVNPDLGLLGQKLGSVQFDLPMLDVAMGQAQLKRARSLEPVQHTVGADSGRANLQDDFGALVLFGSPSSILVGSTSRGPWSVEDHWTVA